ncbi:S-methyl-5-thioribose kinase [Erysipelotrichaceae bacterium AF15-26LB]|nr:S-methyl-5-thioribose kinase [Erysipelotrichaceae bacterium 3_1_53]MCR0346604.1 S-methyl-5-thioribose kinase [[Clostridium] innocuum]RJV91850.1 S-methyl-5-thioribose kinase [Erysipelotrichaceae bacterium AF15-26LB]RJV92034.1 S-methyl-5-thioribose kinase [Erysipelotrichaceae bacterium AF19-24AC]
MNNYDHHMLLDVEEVKRYVTSKLPYFQKDEVLQAEEIGDGNINYVFRVWNPDTGKSIIIKQADQYLRSSGRPLDVYRNKIEAEILKLEGTLAEGFVPKVYAYDETMCVLAMEDISAYKNMRKELMEGHIFPHFAENIAEFLARTLLPTTDLVLDRAVKKDNVKLFLNKELCDITEDLVLTEPYDNYKNRNIVVEENKEFVKEFLYENDLLKADVAQLRDRFMNHAQALVHGDLHSGSIFINENGIKIIDPEFAFYGPMGYDIGNVIGNLFFAWARTQFIEPQQTEFLAWCSHTIAATIDRTMEKLSQVYEQCVNCPLYRTKTFKQQYLKEILSDSLGYAGTEIIRRVVGDSKVMEVTSIKAIEKRVPFERALLKMGIWLIRNRKVICEGTEVSEQFKMICS